MNPEQNPKRKNSSGATWDPGRGSHARDMGAVCLGHGDPQQVGGMCRCFGNRWKNPTFHPTNFTENWPCVPINTWGYVCILICK